MKKLISIGLTIILITLLLLGVNELPIYGDINNPSNNYVSQKYIEDSIEDTGALNVVTGIILDYRAFDTFGEATVLFTAIIAVILTLKEGFHE